MTGAEYTVSFENVKSDGTPAGTTEMGTTTFSQKNDRLIWLGNKMAT